MPVRRPPHTAQEGRRSRRDHPAQLAQTLDQTLDQTLAALAATYPGLRQADPYAIGRGSAVMTVNSLMGMAGTAGPGPAQG
jgi:hypothetical protein